MSDHIDLFPKTVQEGCDEVANKLGYLPLAIDLAGAYIGNNLAPEHVPTHYLEDYGKHRICNAASAEDSDTPTPRSIQKILRAKLPAAGGAPSVLVQSQSRDPSSSASQRLVHDNIQKQTLNLFFAITLDYQSDSQYSHSVFRQSYEE
ncbi:hypothetical protein N7471_005940 [Penicillium samsonianum]|uniref:uncharacterized protein n=1 Tax=Penicillium samsonianum TaxID=1882272 RepID=UPI002547FC77|nr:uncharacterized protein N7471_005940 [Penicillium samsonianum]KAJ6139454.1 hypothetical protein N7471_005940 [Penicillium samsonianum]